MNFGKDIAKMLTLIAWAFSYSADRLRQTPLNENTLKVPTLFFVRISCLWYSGASRKSVYRVGEIFNAIYYVD